MPFAIRHKETGELWTGQNVRNPKLYATEASAKTAITNSSMHSPYTMLGLKDEEYQKLIDEQTEDLYKVYEEAVEHYRRVQRDNPHGTDERNKANKEMRIAYQAYYAAVITARIKIRNEHILWEVAEV